jgi:hypothetical protein
MADFSQWITICIVQVYKKLLTLGKKQFNDKPLSRRSTVDLMVCVSVFLHGLFLFPLPALITFEPD